ncbi:hypothetical protein ANO14919_079640 [Xylariales sp. No.14919]|nr:hypothetical protein ANO14919_079640 [Xylariales sp. No.14919]
MSSRKADFYHHADLAAAALSLAILSFCVLQKYPRYLRPWPILDALIQPANVTGAWGLTRAQLWDTGILLSTCTTTVILLIAYNRARQEKHHGVVVVSTFVVTTSTCLVAGVSGELMVIVILPWALLLALLSSRISEGMACCNKQKNVKGHKDEKIPARH